MAILNQPHRLIFFRFGVLLLFPFTPIHGARSRFNRPLQQHRLRIYRLRPITRLSRAQPVQWRPKAPDLLFRWFKMAMW